MCIATRGQLIIPGRTGKTLSEDQDGRSWKSRKESSTRSILLTIVSPGSTLSSLLSCFNPIHYWTCTRLLSQCAYLLSQFSVSNVCLPPETHFLSMKPVSSPGLGMVALQHRSGHVHMAVSRFSCHLTGTADLNITTHICIVGQHFSFSASSKFPISASLQTSSIKLLSTSQQAFL